MICVALDMAYKIIIKMTRFLSALCKLYVILNFITMWPPKTYEFDIDTSALKLKNVSIFSRQL